MRVSAPTCALLLHGLASGFAFAQPSFSLRVGAAVPFSMSGNEINTFMHSYWAAGISGSLIARYPVTNFMELEGTIEQDIYPYIGRTGWTWTGDYNILATSGDPAQLTRVGLGLKFTSPSDSNKTRRFLVLGGGYALERYGQISTTAQSLSGTIETSEWENHHQEYWTAWIGTGITFRLSRALSLEPALQYRFRLDGWSSVHKLSYCSAMLQLGYRIFSLE
jgi:hypothetical protein